MTSTLSLLALVWLTAAPVAPPPAAPAPTPPVTCSGDLAVRPGRKIYCALDLGSKSAKLQVVSIEPGRPLSFKDERLCKATLGFGAKVYDGKTKEKKPLPAADIANLVNVIQQFKRLCAADKGTLVGAEATQWARDATNMAEVMAAVKAGAAIDIDVLSTEDEGRYGYTAATRNLPERFALDPGSNSFQLGWMEKGSRSPRTVSVDFGYVRAAAAYYAATSADSYEVARAKHAADVTARLEAALAAASPPTSLSALRAAVVAGKLKPQIFLLGQDGALDLAVRATLRGDSAGWIDSKDAYEKQLAQPRVQVAGAPAGVTAVLTPAEVDAWFSKIVGPADYEALRSKTVRDLYGEKALANTVLVDVLVKQLGLTSIALVPQEMPAGYILSKLAKH